MNSKKNCNNCRYIEWQDGDVGDPEGFVCTKKDLYGDAEFKMLAKMDRESYRGKSKVCFELKHIK